MLSPQQQAAFVIFAVVSLAVGAFSWRRVLRQIGSGRADTDERVDRPFARLWYGLVTTLTQARTFRRRSAVSFFHSLIFYGFVFYLLVNLVDALEGFLPLQIASDTLAGALYNLFADVLSAGVLIGVVALVLRRFLLPSRRDFTFNERTMLHPKAKLGSINVDSLIVSGFILFHVGSRAVGAGARLAEEGPDRFEPFATLLSHAFTPANAHGWRVFGYWGALGSVLAFLAYFPRSKHIHIFMAPLKYAVARNVGSGVLPAVVLDLEAESPQLGAEKLEDLAWPRLLDAFACIQCNRCQDVCPATATGKSLSPSALEINKRMELNALGGAPSTRPLLQFALSAEAAWACTTCGACIEVCPVQDEPMLDIIDIRRQQVMMEGEFPAQLQPAFRGMERSGNPWGINQDKRMDWAEGLSVPTTDQKPEPDVLFWVGCAASYDPQSQKTARAFVQLLEHAEVDYAVLGKRECCTGDSARRAGNEYLYRQLADQNVAVLNEIKPKLIVATCPHCMNSVGKEYAQIGGDFKVVHHTEYLASLVADGRLKADAGEGSVAFHDPCYLGRHNGVYEAPRNVLNILSNSVVELDRSRENSFCCGAGGAQFWKEEEPGEQRISDNRYQEAQGVLAKTSSEEKVLAVGCPFCKSMLDSTPGKGDAPLVVKDIAELLLEGVRRRNPQFVAPLAVVEAVVMPEQTVPVEVARADVAVPLSAADPVVGLTVERKKWTPKAAVVPVKVPELAGVVPAEVEADPAVSSLPERKKWAPKSSRPDTPAASEEPVVLAPESSTAVADEASMEAVTEPVTEAPKRKAWNPKRPS